jgi:hypothetical protein
MKKTGIFVFFVVFVLSFASFSAQRADKTFNIGTGTFGGMTAIKADMTVSGASTNINIKDFYLRIGLAYADSQNLAPALSWRRVVPFFVEGVYYLTDDAYVGAGINVPLLVSDKATAQMGSQIFIGSDFETGIIGRAYAEAGYSTINIMDTKSFAGLHCIIGLRYVLI